VTLDDVMGPDDRAAVERWRTLGEKAPIKVGKRWDSCVPGMPFFPTRREAAGALRRFVEEALPLRLALAEEHEDANPRPYRDILGRWGPPDL
jgi:hypothetical protein